MSYRVKIFTSEDVSDTERNQAVERFKTALEETLGDPSLVAPVYRLWLRLYQLHGEHERPWPVTDEEQLLADQWEAAETAATRAAFGENRYMGDAHFEIFI